MHRHTVLIYFALFEIDDLAANPARKGFGIHGTPLSNGRIVLRAVGLNHWLSSWGGFFPDIFPTSDRLQPS
jgi:hypothetical protein